MRPVTLLNLSTGGRCLRSQYGFKGSPFAEPRVLLLDPSMKLDVPCSVEGIIINSLSRVFPMLLHIAHGDEWERAQVDGVYRTESLSNQGFIHCSYPQQVTKVANSVYRGHRGLVLLHIDPDRLDSRVVEEDGGGGEPYPHVYGPINLDAVVKVERLEPGDDGSFTLPDLNDS
jgi:uncharacterized protein (DUF952 family)